MIPKQSFRGKILNQYFPHRSCIVPPRPTPLAVHLVASRQEVSEGLLGQTVPQADRLLATLQYSTGLFAGNDGHLRHYPKIDLDILTSCG